MKNKKFVFSILLIGLLALVSGCTENVRARQWGGYMIETLPKNQKLINITWKEADMWILTRDMRTNEYPEVFYFKEKSSFGVFEGEIKFVETR